jgi:hypothetical protein
LYVALIEGDCEEKTGVMLRFSCLAVLATAYNPKAVLSVIEIGSEEALAMKIQMLMIGCEVDPKKQSEVILSVLATKRGTNQLATGKSKLVGIAFLCRSIPRI